MSDPVDTPTVQTWLRDIERYKAANARLLAALKEAREDVADWAYSACDNAGDGFGDYPVADLARIDAVIEAEESA